MPQNTVGLKCDGCGRLVGYSLPTAPEVQIQCRPCTAAAWQWQRKIFAAREATRKEKKKVVGESPWRD